MNRTIPILFLFLFMIFCSTASAALQTREVSYSSGGTEMKGYLAYDDAVDARRPAILVVHEWWGINDYARKRAEMLAGLGYTALAVDMYGEGRTAAHPEDAGKFAAEIRGNLPVAKERFSAAIEILKNEPTVDPDNIAAIGYCFGGGVVLEMARQGIDLDGVVSFHGSLATSSPAEAGRVKAAILVLNGEDDPFVTAEEIDAFKKEMEAAGATYRFVNYPGARHSFTNPDADRFGSEFGLPLAYDREADTRSWRAMQDFFTEIFARP
ncbi:MAG TPA: dienelactone hydrolase family protein [Desulfobacteraceae bacterium]|nr:dienelactone hydrolase family protein [Desulfobacteraceae bacterium]